MSQPFNTVLIEKERASQVPVNLNNPFNSGDMMIWDSVNLVAKAIAASDAGGVANAANFIGVSQDTNPIPSLGQNLPVPRINIVTRGMCQFTADDNATYNPGDAVTFGSDPQKIRHTAASGSVVIGYVAPENTFSLSGGSVTQGIVAVQGVTQIKVVLAPQFKQLVSI